MNRRHRNNDIRSCFSIAFPILTIVAIGIVMAIVSNYEENWTFNWNGIRKDIKDSVRVSELRGITSGVGGNGVSTINEVNRRRWIMKNATESELLRLTEYPNGTVKAIAYEGLLKRTDFPNRTELALRAINDTAYQVDYQSGCIGWSREIGEYLVHDVLMIGYRSPPLPPEFRSTIRLSGFDKERILAEFRKRKDKEL